MTAQKTFGVFVVLTIASFFVPISPAGAHVFQPSPPGAPYTMEILVDGAPLPRHAARGKTYIEALPGNEYSIRLRNNTDRRVAMALSVDGLNTIDARTTTARSASKWILDPWQEITLDGWQTSASTARRFFFTTEEASYGAWLGKTGNLGVITAVVFREKQMRPTPIGEGKRKDQGEMRSEPTRQGSAGAGSAAGSSSAAGSPSAAPPAKESRAHELSDDLAATGIGTELGHDVVRVAFDAESAPAATLEVRYEYRDALVRLGVLRGIDEPCDPLCRREKSRGFDAMEFAPDPYR